MLPALKEIKRKRNLLGITQTRLAKLSNTSQSLIAKIEAEKVIPSYEKAKKLFDILESLSEKETMTAKEVMSRNILFVKAEDRIKKAIELMEKEGLSQLPVLKGRQSVGLVSDKGLLEKMNAIRKLNINKNIIKEIMEDSLPLVGEDTPVKIIADMLEHSPAVLVSKKGLILGIVTKSDLLKAML